VFVVTFIRKGGVVVRFLLACDAGYSKDSKEGRKEVLY